MKSGRVLAAIAVTCWLTFLACVYIQQRFDASTEAAAESVWRPFRQVIAKMDALERRNWQLRQQLLQLRLSDSRDTTIRVASPCHSQEALTQPSAHVSGQRSAQHEQLWRRLHSGVEELRLFYTGQLKSVLASLTSRNTSDAVGSGALIASLSRIVQNGWTQSLAVLADLQRWQDIDGAGEWRRKQLRNLTNLVQRRLDWLQNPADCTRARKLLCRLNKKCGLGCQLHHVAYCLIVAYGTQRTLLLDTDGWRYSKLGWQSVFQPVSDTCILADADHAAAVEWVSDSQTDQVVFLPVIEDLTNRPPYLPLSIPEDLAEPLLRFHGAPAVWWIGQFVHFLTRPSDAMAAELKAAIERLHFGDDQPVVGVHVRRTDKLEQEAALHDIDEYIAWAESWFAMRELQLARKLRRRILVATDDPAIVNQTRTRYPLYEIVGDETVAQKASEMDSRYADESLHGIIIDIELLANCDYIVCTFSSQVCRVAYELMQVRRGDAAFLAHSLDDVYYFGGQFGHEQKAWLAHDGADDTAQIGLRVADRLLLHGNHWNGFSKGTNLRTELTGLYPSYKVRESPRIVRFPTYAQVSS